MLRMNIRYKERIYVNEDYSKMTGSIWKTLLHLKHSKQNYVCDLYLISILLHVD